MPKTPKKQGKYWYKFECSLCPLCGREDRYKTRMYTEKPESPSDRYFIEEVWDYCGY